MTCWAYRQWYASLTYKIHLDYTWTLCGCDQQISLLMAGVRNIENRVHQAAQAADERARKLQSRVQELEAENLARGLEIKQREREKTELHHQLDAKKPDLAAAIASRAETS